MRSFTNLIGNLICGKKCEKMLAHFQILYEFREYAEGETELKTNLWEF